MAELLSWTTLLGRVGSLPRGRAGSAAGSDTPWGLLSSCGLAVGGALAAVGLYALSGARARTPDLRRFMDGEGPAWYSPPLLAAVRRPRHQGTLAEGTART